jgi:hypothetical protein
MPPPRAVEHRTAGSALLALLLAAAAAVAVPAAPAPAAAAPAAGLARISAHDGGLWAGDRPFRAIGFNWGIGDRGPVLAYFDAPTDAGLAGLTEQLRIVRSLGANSMRVHVEVFQVMDGPTRARPSALRALRRLLAAATREGIYLDLTGNLVWRPQRAPQWYERMDEHRRWQVQARFWRAVARTAASSPAVLCYELTSEPVVTEAPEQGRYHGELGGYWFLQSVAARRGPVAERLGRSWTRLLAAAVRREDDRPVTIGMLPWRGGAFAPANVADLLDLLVVHEYARTGHLEESLDVVRHFASFGKPALLGETFTLHADGATQAAFLAGAAPHLQGVFGFFDGRHPDAVEPVTFGDALYTLNLRQVLGLTGKLRP